MKTSITEFTLRALNSHEFLVAACEAAIVNLEFWHRQPEEANCPGCNTCTQVLPALRHAVALGNGETVAKVRE